MKTANARRDRAVTASDLASKLNAKQTRDGEWLARCPAHDDKRASLHITEKGGKLLVHCFAGCTFEAILKAAAFAKGGGCRTAVPVVDSDEHESVLDIDEIRRMFKMRFPGNIVAVDHSERRIVAMYEDTDEKGELLYQAVRFHPKGFRQRRPDGTDGWIWNLQGVTPVLYRLPEVLKAKLVYIVEGEKDVATLESLGRTATTNSGGAASKWRPEFSAALSGKHIVIIPDNDEPGRKHADAVARSVHDAGAAWVKVVTLPTGKDVTDWMESGGTKERLYELVKATAHYHPSAITISEAPAKGNTSFPLTDLGNAERLVAGHGKDFRWCDAFKCFFIWDGIQWRRDESQQIVTMAKRTVRDTYKQAADIADDKLRTILMTHARATESRQRIEAMIALSRPDVAVSPDAFDSDPCLLTVANGTLDLRTGVLREHRREDLCTKLVGVAYDPEAKCPRWLRFLDEVFEPHPDLIPFIQRAIGYSLTGDVREECFFLLTGSGRNGKGTLLYVIQKILCEFAGTADFTTFTVRRDSGMRDDIAHMRGRRFVVAQESNEGAALAESVIKWLTGGDRVRARKLYENSTEFDPTFKIWLATNYKPEVRGTDAAIWSRIKTVPFDVSFEGREDKSLKKELLREAPGIMAWAVRGCMRWQKTGLGFPRSVVEATQEYRADSDQVGRFVAERCVKSPNGRARAAALYEAYRDQSSIGSAGCYFPR